MLLTITTTHHPATDLGYLLHKHPAKFQCFELAWGEAKVFYPQARENLTTVAMMLELDPVKLVRQGKTLEHYVNDRPYVASSFLSVALAKVFSTALAGRCRDKPELVNTSIPLTAKLPVIPCQGGETLLRKIFEPLGYRLTVKPLMLDAQFPEWGMSNYVSLELQQTITLQNLLSHLYVLIPVLDAQKHYWIGDEEVEKLLRHGQRWLKNHPEQELIAKRYLKRKRRLVRQALAQLVIEEEPEQPEQRASPKEELLEQPLSLNQQRFFMVVDTLKKVGAKRLIDLGCGEGKLIKKLLQDSSFTEIVGLDVSYRCLEIAQEKLHLDRLPLRQRQRIKLLQGSLTYRDKRMFGYDAATVIEVIEHLDLPRIKAFERVLFEFAHPQTIIITIPNIEYNVKFETLAAGSLRHKDHRFEWTRKQFQDWGLEVAEKFNYLVEFYPIGHEDSQVGSPTQMAVFRVTC